MSGPKILGLTVRLTGLQNHQIQGTKKDATRYGFAFMIC